LPGPSGKDPHLAVKKRRGNKRLKIWEAAWQSIQRAEVSQSQAQGAFRRVGRNAAPLTPELGVRHVVDILHRDELITPPIEQLASCPSSRLAGVLISFLVYLVYRPHACLHVWLKRSQSAPGEASNVNQCFGCCPSTRLARKPRPVCRPVCAIIGRHRVVML
jgi:hypothetical protein